LGEKALKKVIRPGTGAVLGRGGMKERDEIGFEPRPLRWRGGRTGGGQEVAEGQNGKMQEHGSSLLNEKEKNLPSRAEEGPLEANGEGSNE